MCSNCAYRIKNTFYIQLTSDFQCSNRMYRIKNTFTYNLQVTVSVAAACTESRTRLHTTYKWLATVPTEPRTRLHTTYKWLATVPTEPRTHLHATYKWLATVPTEPRTRLHTTYKWLATVSTEPRTRLRDIQLKSESRCSNRTYRIKNLFTCNLQVTVSVTSLHTERRTRLHTSDRLCGN